MANRVTYQGGEMEGITSDAATEATLEKLLKAFTAQGGSGSSFNKTAEDAAKKETKARKDGTKATKADTKELTKHTSVVGKSIDALATMTEALVKMAGRGLMNIGESVTGMAGQLMGGGHRLSDFSKHVTGLIGEFPIFGKILGDTGQMFFNVLDGQIDTFRQMSGVGADLGDDLFKWTSKSAEARTSLDTLTSVISENSKTLALSFGGATEGAEMYIRTLSGVRKLSKDFTALGYTVEEQAEYTAEYIELQRRQGLLQGRTALQLTQGTKNYMIELDKLSRITGMSRKEAADAMKAAADDKRLKALMHNMEKNASENLKKTIAMLEAQSPDLANAFKELVATGGVPVTEGATAMALQNQKLTQLAKQFSDGSLVTMDDSITAINAEIDNAKKIVGANGKIISTSMAAGVTGVWDSVLDLLSMNKIKDYQTAIDEQTKAQEAQTKQLAEFESNAIAMQTKIQKEFIESDVFKKFTDTVAKLTTELAPDGKVDKAITEGVKKLTEGGSKLWDFFTDSNTTGKEKLDKAWTFVKEKFESFATKIMGWLGFGSETGASEKYTKAASKLNTVNAEIVAIKDKIESGTLNPEQMDKALKKLAELKKEAEGYQAVMDQEKAAGGGPKENSFLGQFKNLNWEGIVAGLGIVGAAFVAFKAALFLGPIILSAITAIMGLLLIGAGVVSALGGALWIVANAMVKLSDGMVALGNVQVTPSFKELPGIMGDLAGPMAQLGGAGILAFLGAGGLTKLADNLKSFEQLNVDVLTKVGPALTSLYGGISAFTGDSLLDKAGKWLGSFFTSSNISDMAEGLKEFEIVDTAHLEKIGNSLSGISEFVNSMEADNVEAVATAIKNLAKAMDKFEDEMSDMNKDVQATFSSTVSGMAGTSKGQSEAINELNTVVKELLAVTQEGNRIERQQLEAIKEGSGVVG